MELQYRLVEPTIPPKEGYYIARGHMTGGSIHKTPKFVADFYIPKPYDMNSLEWGCTFQDLFIKSVRRYKKETDAEFLGRCSMKFGEHYIFYHYEDDLWYWDRPWWETLEKMKKMREVA
jgi:hypothetical protein